MTLIYRNTLILLGLFVSSLILFTWGLASEEVVGFDSRFYLFALEMWNGDFTWFPTTYHEPYPDYPVTAIYLIYLTAELFGQLNKLTAILPSAIAAAITVFLTYLVGSLHNKRWGFYSVLFLLLTFTFLKSARSITLDMYTAMITVASFYNIYSADIYKKPGRVWWIYPLLFMGFIFRGPIGLIIPTGVICTYYFLEKRFKKGLFLGLLAFVLLIFCIGLLLALAYHVGESNFMYQVLHMQVLGRIDNKYHPFYYYFISSFKDYALAYPIAFLVIASAAYSIYKRHTRISHGKFLLLLFGWVMVILIGMSLPGDKKIRYILPIAPALALLAAYPFATETKRNFLVWLRQFLLGIFLYFPAIFLLLTETVYYYAKYNSIDFQIDYLPIALFFVGLQIINFYLVYSYVNKQSIYEPWIFFIASLSWVLTYIFIIEPIIIYRERAREFVRAIETERIEQHAALVFYKEKPDGTPIKYLINMPKLEQPIFIKNKKELADFKNKAFFITSESYFTELPDSLKNKLEILANDTMGHIRIVVFTQKGPTHD